VAVTQTVAKGTGSALLVIQKLEVRSMQTYDLAKRSGGRAAANCARAPSKLSAPG